MNKPDFNPLAEIWAYMKAIDETLRNSAIGDYYSSEFDKNWQHEQKKIASPFLSAGEVAQHLGQTDSLLNDE